MTYQKPAYIQHFQPILVLLVCFMTILMGGSSCGCGNQGQYKPRTAHQGSLSMEVTPTDLKGDQRTTTITFVPTASDKSKRATSLERYQLQVSFPANTRVYYTSDNNQIEQPLKCQEKVKLAKLLSVKEISSAQALKLTMVPDPNLQSVEMELKLVDTESEEDQKHIVHWKQDLSLSAIRIKLGHNSVNNRVIYSLVNEDDKALTGNQLRYTNISPDGEGKKVVLNSQRSSTLPIPELPGGGSTENQFLDIDFKGTQQATFTFEVINPAGQVVATREEVFKKDALELRGNNRAFQEIVEELNKDVIDMDKMERLLDQPGIPLDQPTVIAKNKDHTYVSPVTLVTRAVLDNHIDVVKQLIRKGVDVNARAPEGLGPLEMAARHGNEEMVRTLLEAGAHVNGDSGGVGTPLQLASRYGNVAVLRELLKNDQLDINKPDSQGRTGFHLLIGAFGKWQKSNEETQALLEIMKEMISQGADVNKQTVFGSTPLHWTGNLPTEVMELLLNVPNIQVDVQDEEGYTPLHYLVHSYLDERDSVVLKSLAQKISLLVQQGADIHLKSKEWKDLKQRYTMNEEWKNRLKAKAGKSVLELAQKSGNDDLVKLLKKEVG